MKIILWYDLTIINYANYYTHWSIGDMLLYYFKTSVLGTGNSPTTLEGAEYGVECTLIFLWFLLSHTFVCIRTEYLFINFCIRDAERVWVGGRRRMHDILGWFSSLLLRCQRRRIFASVSPIYFSVFIVQFHKINKCLIFFVFSVLLVQFML